jgi:hypothetical protein
MVSWIGTRLFYAVLFFCLGAWVASVSPGMKNMVRHASEASSHGFETLGAWTSSTLSPATEKATEKAPAALEAAPVAGELLVAARAAYARKDFLGSINAYRGYIDRNPKAIEARGELGNVYFATGRLRDAGQAYFEAAMLKLKSGDIAGAQGFLGAVQQGDGALGDELRREIAKVESSGK